MKKLKLDKLSSGRQIPPKRHTASIPSTRRSLEKEVLDGFAVLAHLTCSQKKEVDRTGTLRVPRTPHRDDPPRVAKPSQERVHHRRKRKTQVTSVQVCMTTARPDSPAGSAGSQGEERGSLWNGTVTQFQN